MKEYTPPFITRLLQKAHEKLLWWWACYYIKILKKEYFYVRGYSRANGQRIHKHKLSIMGIQERLDIMSQQIAHLYEAYGLELPPKKQLEHDSLPDEAQP